MSDETDATSEVARVLGEHHGWHLSRPRKRPSDIDVYGCRGCPAEIWRDEEREGWTAPAMRERFAAHQAAMLAEAGLLDDAARPEGIERHEVAYALTPFMDMQTRYRATAAVWKLITRKPDPEQAQIATQEPAGATRGGSGDSRVPGGLDGAPVDPLDISALLSQVARLEQDKDQWRDSANTAETELREASRVIVRVRALAQWFRDQGQTGYARKVEEALDGTAPEPVSENPFRMPEDRA
jgi:hypothetical protein